MKNKAPAEIQITAEQLLREAKERDLEILPPPPKQKISDPAELADYQHRKRKAFEDNLRKNRMVVSNWIKYAQWEESQKEVQRARSIWERAIDNDHRNITIWLKYIEMEMKNRQVNHARNLFDRAVTILPRVNQFWYKYVYMEEMLENMGAARAVFERLVCCSLLFIPKIILFNHLFTMNDFCVFQMVGIFTRRTSLEYVHQF